MTESAQRSGWRRSGTLLAAAALLGVAAPVRATPFQATLSLAIDSAVGSLGGVTFVGSGSGASAPNSVTAPSGIFAGTALIPVAGVASLSAVSIQVSGNRGGHFVGSPPFLRGDLPISGALRLKGSLGAGAVTLANVPLGFTRHAAGSAAIAQGFGAGGRASASSFVADFFYEWRNFGAYVAAPWGNFTYTYHIAGGQAASRRFTYHYVGAEGSDARTPGGLGQVTLVSPIRIETTLPGTGSLLVVFGTLTLNFVPEPGTLVLLGAGAVALGFLGKRRLRL